MNKIRLLLVLGITFMVSLGFGLKCWFAPVEVRHLKSQPYAQFVKNLPSKGWVRVSNGTLDLSKRAVEKDHGVLKSAFLPMSKPGAKDQVRVVVRTSDSKILAALHEDAAPAKGPKSPKSRGTRKSHAATSAKATTKPTTAMLHLSVVQGSVATMDAVSLDTRKSIQKHMPGLAPKWVLIDTSAAMPSGESNKMQMMGGLGFLCAVSCLLAGVSVTVRSKKEAAPKKLVW